VSVTRPRLFSASRLELALMVVILLIAAFFRLHRIDAVPPGPSHDELRMMQLGELIVEGERPIHWTISYSAEPLFMYLLALVMPVLGFSPFAARIVTRYVGLLLIPLLYILARRLFGRRVALIASAALALTWWPVFFSRVALRGITLPLLMAAAVYFWWRGLDLDGKTGTRWGWLALGGGMMGLTWYTFTAARGLFLLLPLVLAHLGLMRQVPVKQLWRIALLTLSLAVLIAAPFVYDVVVNPGAPETRFEQLGGIIEELRAGNVLPFIRQAGATMGMFVLTGDPNWRYNVSHRPVFGPALGGLAVLGVLVSIIRWRRPAYFLLFLWLLLGWAASMLTPESPSLVRAIGALPPAVIFCGIGGVALWDAAVRHAGRLAAWVVPILLCLLVVLNSIVTFRDYFCAWPDQPQVREIYQASLTEAFQDLNRSTLDGPIWVSEPFPDDRHLMLAQRALQRSEIELRWFDAGRALILPPADGLRRYLLADFAAPDPLLVDRWLGQAAVLLEREPVYQLYQVEGGPWVEQELAAITTQSSAFAYLGAQQAVPLPAAVGESVALLGYELVDELLTPGGQVHLVVYWRVGGPVFQPLSSFVHLLDGQGSIVGQYDGFDVPPWHWEPGAVIAQGYRFPISENAQPGSHWLEVGLYNPQTMERLPIIDNNGIPLGDRLVLQEVLINAR